jgi:predicted transcriptional regulator
VNNKVVETYVNNFSLINSHGMEAFIREQSKLLSPALVAVCTDYRGTLTEHGIDGYFRGLEEWSKHFQSNHRSRYEFLEDTPTHVSMRVLNRLGLVAPVNGRTVSEEDEHDWTEEFEVGLDGLIRKVNVIVILKERRS